MTPYLIFFILVCSSAFFSSSETAFFNISKHRRHQLADDPRRAARKVASLRDHPRSLLVTVLFGNELTNIALSIVSARITHGLFPDLNLTQVALLSASIVVPTLLIFGEITPKSIAALSSERIALIFAYPLSFFSWLITPARWLLLVLADRVTKLFGEGESEESEALNEESFRALVDAVTREGVIDRDERELIQNAFHFGDQTVKEVMVPWRQVYTLDESTSISEAITQVSHQPFSRIPLISSEDKTVIGILYTKDLLIHRWAEVPPPPTTTLPIALSDHEQDEWSVVDEENGSQSTSSRSAQAHLSDPMLIDSPPRYGDRTVRTLAHRVVYTQVDQPITMLLETFKRTKKHMAMVFDQSSMLVGICTLEDVLEVLFGPISEESMSEDDEDFMREVHSR